MAKVEEINNEEIGAVAKKDLLNQDRRGDNGGRAMKQNLGT